ncbi:MAG: hypothetical protein JWQ01_2796 [Massilia sp.]|nr:hypothetical protein [Massilia sp.]
MNATRLAVPGSVIRAMRCCVALVLLLAGAQAQAGLSFRMEVATHNAPGANTTGSRPGDDTRTSQVVLGDRHMVVTTAGASVIYDFASRRRYEIDLKAGTYVDYSLFDTLGFRTMEVRNRQNLGRALAAAKLERKVFDPVFDEQSLSVSSDTQRTLSESAEDADTVLSIDGKALMRIAAGGTPVSAGDAAAFTRFVRYQFGGHPLVLAKLAALRRVPSRFVMNYAEAGGAQTRTFTIAGLAPADAPGYDMGKYTARGGGADEIDQLLDRARTTRWPTQEQSRLRAEGEMSAAFDEKRPLDAMLGAIELTLVTGAPMTPFPVERLPMIQADPSVRALLGAMNPQDKAGQSAAVRVLQSLRPQTMSKRHMLQLFEANHRAKLGERAAALELFASVLRANPALAGAYKDMGDVLFIGFDMPRAWRSWDQGRRIAPRLNLFEAVDQFEQKLLREYPEYF